MTFIVYSHIRWASGLSESCSLLHAVTFLEKVTKNFRAGQVLRKALIANRRAQRLYAAGLLEIIALSVGG